MKNLDINLIDIDNLVNKFFLDRQQGLVSLHKIYFKNNNKISYRAFIEELFEELKDGCISFVNKNNTLDGLENYLFYIANAFCKKNAVIPKQKIKEYICPGCLFLGKKNLLNQGIDLICYDCLDEHKKAVESKWLDFFGCFKKHCRTGFRCLDCDRFIPQPLYKSDSIVCPYTDCCFVGSIDDLKKMSHPTSNTIVKHIYVSDYNSNNNLISPLEIKEELDLKIKTIKNVIEQQINTTHWNSFNFTIKHKIFVYQAFKNILEKHPIEMVSYLLESSRSGGFQHKLFQEYISILESNLPLPYKKGKEIKTIQSLLDEELSLFDGISVFDGIVNEKCEVKNNTQEIYIGGRKAAKVQPFYIGKLLNVILTDSKDPVMHLVKNYSFSKIKLHDIASGSKVTVTHLRIPPHYQMGGMVYVNRIRKKIIDKVLLFLKKDEFTL